MRTGHSIPPPGHRSGERTCDSPADEQLIVAFSLIIVGRRNADVGVDGRPRTFKVSLGSVDGGPLQRIPLPPAQRVPRPKLGDLARAEKNGDQVLARSIAMRAFEESRNRIGGYAWGPVIDAYTASRPEVASKMEELAEAQRQSAAKSLGRAMIFSLSKPRELQRMSDTQIQALANQQPEAAPQKLSTDAWFRKNFGAAAGNPYDWTAPR